MCICCDCVVIDTMSSSESGVSDTIDPVDIVSDDKIAPDPEVYTSNTDSSDDDDFQLFALPDFGDEIPLADGLPDGDLLLVPIPAHFPLAAFPLEICLLMPCLTMTSIFLLRVPQRVPKMMELQSPMSLLFRLSRFL
ncbi:hypothetical protein Hanom_Chr11g01035591 [Helianthus anomalus]